MIRIRKTLLIIICFFLMMGLVSFYPNNFNINIKTDGIYLKSEINIDVLKQVAAKNLSSDDLEKNDFDPWGFDFNNVKIFYNNVKITSEILNISLKEGKYFKFDYQIFKVNQLVKLGCSKIYVLSKEEANAINKLEEVDEVLINNPNVMNIKKFTEFYKILINEYPLYSSKVKNIQMLVGKSAAFSRVVLGEKDTIVPNFFAFYSYDGYFFGRKVIHWTYFNDSLRAMKQVLNKISPQTIGTIWLDSSDKTREQLNKKFIEILCEKIRGIIGNNYPFEIMEKTSLLWKGRWDCNKKDLLVHLNPNHQIATIEFDNGYNYNLFVNTQMQGIIKQDKFCF
ncbi:hypothetical protein [Spiroplasma endosymbiont of Dilophus febrilis]|uniref:hypothetical protein n=1 Tax=Spiroplasma endosymbiont of Dilophus febrilis TaxID=3066292 RepID=UPI00313BF1D1